MLMHPTDQFMDKYVAPHYSEFTGATIPDLSSRVPASGSWLVSFAMNSALRAQMDDATRQTMFNFLRRADGAFCEYSLARLSTLQHVENAELRRAAVYFDALRHWEQFLSQLDHALDVLARDEKRFQPKDGSLLQRINLLYGRSKHVRGAIKSGQLPPDGTVPVWLTNDGLQAVDGRLTFAEMAELMSELATWAEAAQDPLTMQDTLRVAYGRPEDDRGT